MENNETPQNVQDGNIPTLDSILDPQTIVSTGDDGVPPINLPEGSQEGQEGQGGNPDTPPVDTPPTDNPPVNTPAPEDDVVALLSKADSSLSADDITFKSTVFDMFKATNIDFKGNLLDANNNIVLTAENLNNYIETGEVPLDDKGNQVDALGNIIKEAADVNAAYNVVNMTREFIEQDLGFALTDEEGKPRVYENTADGNKAFAKDLITAAQVSAVSAFFNNEPEVKNFFYHLKNGGTIDNFNAGAIDYTSIDIDGLSKEKRLEYIKEAYTAQGVKNPESIMKLLESAGDEVLKQSTAEALLALKGVNDAKLKANEEAFKAQEAAEQKRVAAYWDNINGLINKGNLGSITIPDTEKSGFLKYIAEPINSNGDTQEVLDFQKEDPSFQLMVSYLRYKGGDINKFIQAATKSNRLDKLRSRVGIESPVPKIESNKERVTETRGAFVPSIESLLG